MHFIHKNKWLHIEPIIDLEHKNRNVENLFLIKLTYKCSVYKENSTIKWLAIMIVAKVYTFISHTT